MTGRAIRFALPLGVLLALATPARAQTGSVSGTVVDETSAVVRGAAVVLAGASSRETTTTGARGEYLFEDVSAGTYRLLVFRVGFAEAARENVVVGTDAVALVPIQLSVATMAETVVVSASRSESALIDAPATMTVLPASTLAVSPAQNFGDLLRSVPGVNVIQMSARDVNLTSRQATTPLAASQLVLVDGRSVYLDFFGMVLWDFVPTNVENIQQVEVVRGPASAVWGANALTGIVNIVTRSPRESAGRTTVTASAGLFDRDAGSAIGRGAGASYGLNATTSQVVSDTWSYRVSAGYFNSRPYARPIGRIPVIVDPRDPAGEATVGGAFYPVDAEGPIGSTFRNRGTSQPKFEARVDQDLPRGRVTYTGGVAGTEGTVHTGIGPFDIQPGSIMAYGRMSYTQGALSVSVLTNLVDADAPSQLVPDPLTGRPLQLDFKTQTYDVEVRHATLLGRRQALNYGGNYRRNNFDITVAPTARDRNEIGAYIQDEIFLEPFRFSIGTRVDKFGNLEDLAVSPRFTAIYYPRRGHAVRFGFNRAFRSPSSINNYIDVALASPVDLSGLAPLLPPELAPAVAEPFPLAVRVVGTELPIASLARPSLKKESLAAYELAYTGLIRARTTVGAAVYVNDMDDSITFMPLAPAVDPYTSEDPPPGWPLPPFVLDLMAAQGILLPRTAFSYFNLGPTRQKGLELSIEHQAGGGLSAFANYSWQGTPRVLDDADPFPFRELSLPPRHRFNIGAAHAGRRFLGALSAHYAARAFWSDVLTPDFDGFTGAYTMVNGSFGIRWRDGRVTTSIKGTNLLNQTIQQHIFGDLLRRSATAEVRLDF
jgi:outer membrane receptor protein involved in Fe transport